MTASLVSSQKLFARKMIEMGVHAPSDTNADVCSGLGYRDLRDFGNFGVLALVTALGSNSANGITTLEIVASDASNGATNVTQIKTTGVVNTGNSSLSNYLALECLSEEIDQIGRAAGLSLRYVAARLTMDSANSEAAVTYIRSEAAAPHLDMTASVIR
jgi:hypothetical protein